MLTNTVQRWRDRRETYRPSGEVIDTSRYEVGDLALAPAREFVTRHHYSGSYPADRVRAGLYRGAELVGVAVFSVPMSYRVFDCLGCPPDVAVELGRLVLLDDVPANGESWFIARCFEMLKAKGYAGLVSFSDPVPRAALDGRVTHVGHIGVIYQASNAAYLGCTRTRTLRLLPDGTVFSDRSISKVRGHEVGWRYSVDQLVAHGAPEPRSTSVAALRAWLPGALDRVTRKLRHTGNHKYAWGLSRAVRRGLTSKPYPKHKGATRPTGAR